VKSLFFHIFLGCALAAEAQTFPDVLASFPLGTTKEAVLQKEPTAVAVPCHLAPIDPTLARECLVWMKASPQTRLMAQGYLVEGKLAALMLGRVSMPGVAVATNDDTLFLSDRKSISTFTALRTDGELNPVEVTVKKVALEQPDQVALLVSSGRGSELWIVDGKIFRPQSFFMEPTAGNRQKLIKSKKAIEAQKRDFEELKKSTR
jgi:hypothetical protein